MQHDEVSEKLVAALPWNARRTQLEPVLKSATLALLALTKLDEYIFEKRTGSGGLVVDALARTKKDKDGKAGRFLRGVAGTMWEGAKTFIWVVDNQLGAHLNFDDEPELDLDALDFDFAPPSTDVASIGDDDIDRQHELVTAPAQRFTGYIEGLILHKRFAHSITLGLEKGVRHTTADKQPLHLGQEIIDNFDLARDLGAPKDGNERVLRMLEHATKSR